MWGLISYKRLEVFLNRFNLQFIIGLIASSKIGEPKSVKDEFEWTETLGEAALKLVPCLFNDRLNYHISIVTGIKVTRFEMEKDSVETRVFDINATTYTLEAFQRNAMIIFNHENFLYKKQRYGTGFDEDVLINTFEQFKFDVTVHKDFEKATLFAELQKFSKQNFEDCGCVCVAVLTHGSDYGFLDAFDASYSERELFACFDATKNPSLAGKPIVFLIQACRGEKLASSVHVPGSEERPVIELDADIRRAAAGYFLPTESDMIIFHSCFFGRASVRETHKGTWFIQTVCKQINQHASNEHLEKIFRRVRNIVALEKEHACAKQMPVVTSTLLRKLFLKRQGESGSERQRVEISKEPLIAACPSCSPRLIETYFESTTIVGSMSRQVQYCNATSTKHPIDMSQVIDFYRTQEHVHSYKYNNPNTPTTEHGVLVVSGGWQLPLYQIADIRRHHLLPQSEPEFKKGINEHMKLMGRLNTDDIGYLLHHTLGGSSTNINVIPMAQNVHQRPIAATDGSVINKSILPRSFWKSNEDCIQRFLNTNPNGRVSWKVAVQYEEGVITNPENFINYRPISFSLQYTAYTHRNDDTSRYYISPQMTFRNDNSNGSGDNELPPFDLVLNPNVPEGRFGSVMSRGVWPSAHQMSFPYTIQGRTYFYGQSLTDGRLWFIQELLPYGQMGARISRGYWEIEYQVVFPFNINGRQFFYGHNHITKLWVIQELLPDGKMGEETSSGQWSKTHQVAFPFSINFVHYFFGQSIGCDWFIRELLPGGKMGKETCTGTWKSFYEIVFPYKINMRQYCYIHSHKQKSWVVLELLPGGQMGKETSNGFWESTHRVSVPYSINGKHYFFGQKVVNGTWWIAELLPNGRMGHELRAGLWSDQYSVAFTFSINGAYYIYGHSSKTCSWFIKELL